MTDRVPEDKQRAHFERTKKGVLRWLAEQGGSATLADMHEYSSSKFLVAHQGFSKLMESCVEEALVDYDRASNTASLTDAGRAFAGA
jgi:hypothetical protein